MYHITLKSFSNIDSVATLKYNTIQYNTIQYNTIQYNTIQYNTIQYNNCIYFPEKDILTLKLAGYFAKHIQAKGGGGGGSLNPPTQEF